MGRKEIALTKDERDILVLGATRANGKQLSNADISRNLGISTSRVKAMMHRICVKLKADNRNEAIVLALMKGEIRLDEICTVDQIVEGFYSTGSDTFKRIAESLRYGVNCKHLIRRRKSTSFSDGAKGKLLTKSEREVVILASHGLTNKEIADRLCISTSAVRTFLYRINAKLGATNKADAVVSAAIKGEINVLNIWTPSQLIQILTPLGADYVEKMAQLMDQKHVQDTVHANS